MNRRWRQFVILPMLIVFLCLPIQAFAAKKLIPMGEAIGIQLQLSHVFVAHDVLLASNQWMKGGAVIEKINDTTVKHLMMPNKLLRNRGNRHGR